MYPQGPKTVQRLFSENKVEEANIPLSQLSSLKGTKQIALAFDGIKVLDIITQRVREETPLAVYTSSTPLCVYKVIDEFIEMTNHLSNYYSGMGSTFKPVFVFNGCGFMPMPDITAANPLPISPVIAQLSSMGPTTHFDPATLEKNVLKNCADRFNIEEDLESLIVRRFHWIIEDTFRAPYLAWSQISSFFSAANMYVSEVFGSVEMLAFPGVERVITKIDVEKGTFDCITKAAALKALRSRISHLSEEDFASLLLLDSKAKGFAVNFPHGSLTVFEEFSRLSPDGSASRAQRFIHLPRFSADIANMLRRNLAALDAPVMTIEGKCVALGELFDCRKKSVTKDYYGKPEPSVFYYFLFSGVAMPAPYAALSQSTFVEDWPLVDTAFYRGVCERVLPLRVQTSFQFFQYVGTGGTARLRWLRQFLNFRSKDFLASCWSNIQNPPEVELAYWAINPAEVIRNEGGNVYLLDIMKFAACAVEERVTAVDMPSTISSILLKSLDLIGYFTHSSVNEREASGTCSYSLALCEFNCPTLSEYGVLFIELVRTRTLHDDPIELTPISANMQCFRAPVGARFAARAVSIIPINLASSWSGPFDPEMAAFGAASRLFGRTLRLLTEVNAAMVFATGATRVPFSQFDQALLLLPYSIPIEFNAGFLMMHVLMNPGCTLESLSATFPDLACLADDLGTLFWFWSMAYRSICVILTQEKPVDRVMEPTILLEAHELMSGACFRLCRSCWAMYYSELNRYTDAVVQYFGLYDCNVMMHQPPMPQTMYNNNYGGYA